MTLRDKLIGLLQRNEPWDPSEGGWLRTTSAASGWSSLMDFLDTPAGTPTPTDPGMEDLRDAAAQTVGENIVKAARAEYDELHGLYGQEPIDSRILAMMRAVEWFVERRGDMWQAFTAPLDLGLSKPQIQHKDDGVRKRYEEIYRRLKIMEILEATWLDCEVRGQAYPVLLPDKKGKGGGVGAITLLNPKHVAVGRAIGPSSRSLVYTPLADTRNSLLDTATRQDEQRLQQMFHFALQDDWNEWVSERQGRGFPLNPDYVFPIRHRKLWQQRYAIPPGARALDDASTRLVLDEMIRGTIDGVHNQWRVWTISNPRKGEVTQLGAQVKAGRQHRTADFVWDDRLKQPWVISPDSIDALLAPETWWRLTLSIYRQLGMFVRIISGEDPGGSRGGEAIIDVQILLGRLNYQRSRTLDFLDLLNRHIADADSAIEEPPTVSFRPPDVEWIAKLQAVVPLLNFGILSAQTTHNWLGLEHDREIERLKTEQPLRDEGIIRPYTGFAQSGPSGTAESPQSQGRPRGPAPQTSQQNTDNAKTRAHALEAAEANRMDYESETLAAFDVLASHDKEDKDGRQAMTLAFIATLIALRAYRSQAFEEGYLRAGGVFRSLAALHELPRHTRALAFDDDNLRRFQADLLMKVQGGELFGAADRLRASQYATAGWRHAYMAGVFEAQSEHGFTGWQRLLNPAASKAGPCQECIEDSRFIHSLDEPFMDHVNGVCGIQMVSFFHPSELPLPFRVPSYIPFPGTE